MTLRAKLRWVCFAILALAAPVRGEELRDLPVASGLGVADIDERGCGVNPVKPESVVRARLIVRDTLRRIGPYVVSLPAYSSMPDMLPPDAVEPWGPFQIKAKPGDTLRIDLVNQLADNETIPQTGFAAQANKNTNDKSINLHTHGLIVAPRPFTPCGSLGDYIFQSVDWKSVASYRIKIPERVAGGYGHLAKGDAGYNGEGPYPVGPYWIHSHVHGLAKPAVLGGQSAFLSVDCPKPDDPVSCPNGHAGAGVEARDVKILALRDLQVWVDHDPTKDFATPPDLTSNAQNAFFVTDLYDTKACEPAVGPLKGFCANPAAVALPDGQTYRFGTMSDAGVQPPVDANGKPLPSPQAYVAWLFPVNGQIYPTITVEPHRPQLWRVANMSAVTTYKLRLVRHEQGKPDQNVGFKVLTVDGVLAGTPTGAGDFTPKRSATELLLMPSARAEIVVDWQAPEPNVTLTLENERFCTGVTDTPFPSNPPTPLPPGYGHQQAFGCSADPYPNVSLAEVVMAPALASAALSTRPVALSVPSQKFQRHRIRVDDSSGPLPANCIGLPRSGYRTIRFEQDQANFFIGPVNTDATDDAERIADVHSFRHDNPPGLRRHICVAGGEDDLRHHRERAELWLLENDTDELHNFHIHQSKFRLATPAELEHAKITEAVHDPNGLLAARAQEAAAALRSESTEEGAVWHDSIPVPPRKLMPDGSKDFGHVAIVIPFSDENQVGTFVYHCHILEHEDGGMMAAVEVYNARHPRTAAAETGVRAAGFCGQPPAGYTPIPARDAGWRGRLADLIGL